MADVSGVAGDRLKSFIERIERLEEERQAIGADIKEVFAEAKGNGFDTKIMRQLIKERRMDKDDLDEQETLLDVYRRAIGMLPLFARAAAQGFVDAVAPNDGDSVTLTGPNGDGVAITNAGGKKTVGHIGDNA